MNHIIVREQNFQVGQQLSSYTNYPTQTHSATALLHPGSSVDSRMAISPEGHVIVGSGDTVNSTSSSCKHYFPLHPFLSLLPF